MGAHLTEREISFEEAIEIEYVEQYPPPEPKECMLHDDWVSAVQTYDNWYEECLCQNVEKTIKLISYNETGFSLDAMTTQSTYGRQTVNIY